MWVVNLFGSLVSSRQGSGVLAFARHFWARLASWARSISWARLISWALCDFVVLCSSAWLAWSLLTAVRAPALALMPLVLALREVSRLMPALGTVGAYVGDCFGAYVGCDA